MTDAPERIWLEWEGPHETEHHLQLEPYSFECSLQKEYVRADLAKPRVRELEWDKSAITPWDGDYHTLPTFYAIRGLGNEDYRLFFPGGFEICNSPEAAKVAAQADYERRILSALILPGDE